MKLIDYIISKANQSGAIPPAPNAIKQLKESIEAIPFQLLQPSMSGIMNLSNIMQGLKILEQQMGGLENIGNFQNILQEVVNGTATYQQLLDAMGDAGLFAASLLTYANQIGSAAASEGISSSSGSGSFPTPEPPPPITHLYMMFQDNWDSSHSYTENDVVIYSGALYLAKTPNSNVVPTNTSYWIFLAGNMSGGNNLSEISNTEIAQQNLQIGKYRTVFNTATTSNNIGVSTAGLGELEIRGKDDGSAAIGAAMMAFHRPYQYAAYFGIDIDNKWKVGGWSAGNNAYEIYHKGNVGSYGQTILSSNDSSTIRGTLDLDNLAGYRNKIINGNFDIWQRATSQSISGYGSADRWDCQHSGSTKNVTRGGHELGTTSVPGNPTYYMATTVTSVAGAANYVANVQKIESVRTLAGRQATLTFYAVADTTRNIAIEFIQYFGTGGSPSAINYGIGSQLVGLTTSWQKISILVNIPSIAGKTLGSNNNDYLSIAFWLDAGSDYNARAANLGQQSGTFYISRVSLVEGDATGEYDPYGERSIQQEDLLCKRYFQVHNITAFGLVTGESGGNAGRWPLYFPPMRTTPTGSLPDGNYQAYISSTWQDRVTTLGIVSNNYMQLTVDIGSNSAMILGRSNGRRIYLSSEL